MSKMKTKRPADNIDTESARPHQRANKRTKLSTPVDERDDSSVPSSCSVSEDSALQSSPRASEHTRKSSLSSIPSSDADDVSGSSTEISSSASESLSEDEATIITIGGPKKPQIAQANVVDGAGDLRSRLDALLPRLAASNQLLARSDGAMSMEDVKEGERHIEMDLGLGVLEEKGDGDSRSSSESSDASSDHEREEEDVSLSSSPVKQPRQDRGSRVMATLMGRSKDAQSLGIEDLGEESITVQ